jgi:hypothetical protein
MSTWIEIKDQEDVEYDESPMTAPTIDVLISDDQFGNNYVSIPLEFIINVLVKEGFDVTYPL